MNKEKLKEANRLNKLIEEHEQALNCFEFDTNYYARDEDPNLPIALESTNPILIIEHDVHLREDGNSREFQWY